ncbi:multicopper oxidase domain-containing protein [Actinoplanes subtropicus]|uniref:multicopper oxidase domain-containing protein n=1 Tax=Actinoplanes subtropicus TaxID=543632 RepID=UPI0004C2F4B2|nr:multicopper oxidase domain-containing protein [Actinoplanes subtropicus]
MHVRKGALVLALVAVGVCAPSPASAAPVTITLCALPGTATMAGGANVPIWGFATGCANPGLPGPVLSVTVGDTVAITVTNALPAGHPLTFEAPGITFDPGPDSAPPGGTVTRTFTASAPGTYLYQSGGDAGRQAAMGLSGALIVRPATAPTDYDVEAPLVLSAVDPAFNAAPETFDMHAYRATYWLINGKSYPDTAPGITAAGGQRVLLRYLNAGYDNTTMTMLGMHGRVVARDARPVAGALDVTAETIPAGATEDAIVTVPAGAGPSPHGFPLYNRQQHLTNGPQTATGPAPATGGGPLKTTTEDHH